MDKRDRKRVGRKLKFGEETTVVSVRIPKRMKKIVMDKIYKEIISSCVTLQQ